MKNFIKLSIPKHKETVEVDINKIEYNDDGEIFIYNDELEKKELEKKSLLNKGAFGEVFLFSNKENTIKIAVKYYKSKKDNELTILKDSEYNVVLKCFVTHKLFEDDKLVMILADGNLLQLMHVINNNSDRNIIILKIILAITQMIKCASTKGDDGKYIVLYSDLKLENILYKIKEDGIELLLADIGSLCHKKNKIVPTTEEYNIYQHENKKHCSEREIIIKLFYILYKLIINDSEPIPMSKVINSLIKNLSEMQIEKNSIYYKIFEYRKEFKIKEFIKNNNKWKKFPGNELFIHIISKHNKLKFDDIKNICQYEINIIEQNPDYELLQKIKKYKTYINDYNETVKTKINKLKELGITDIQSLRGKELSRNEKDLYIKKLNFLNETVVTTSNINYEELIKIINECELKYVEQIYNDSDDSDSDFDLKFE